MRRAPPGLPGGSPERWESKGNARGPGGRAYGKCNLRLHVSAPSGASALRQGVPRGAASTPGPAGRLPRKGGNPKGNARGPRRARLRKMQPPVACKCALRGPRPCGKGFPGVRRAPPGLPGGSPGKVGIQRATPVAPGGRAYGKCNLRLHVSAPSGGLGEHPPAARGSQGVRRAPPGAGRLPGKVGIKGNARPRRARLRKMQPPVACKCALRGPRPCGKGFPGVRRAPRACREAPRKGGNQRATPVAPEGALTENAASGCM